MTRFQIYDTNGAIRDVCANLHPDRMRILLSIFRTHCAVEGKQYEYNHFVNWLRKYHDVDVVYTPEDMNRIDM
jgi:hypothetical protein